MRDPYLLGPWIRRFLMEHLVGERNLALNTRRSYRDTLQLLLPYVARCARKSVDRLHVADMSADRVRQFLTDLEEKRRCGIATRNQRLAAIHSLARFVGQHAVELVEWCGQVRAVPFNPDYSMPSPRGCRPGASSPFVKELQPGPAPETHRPLPPSWEVTATGCPAG
jgi:hypothetical protein